MAADQCFYCWLAAFLCFSFPALTCGFCADMRTSTVQRSRIASCAQLIRVHNYPWLHRHFLPSARRSLTTSCGGAGLLLHVGKHHPMRTISAFKKPPFSLLIRCFLTSSTFPCSNTFHSEHLQRLIFLNPLLFRRSITNPFLATLIHLFHEGLNGALPTPHLQVMPFLSTHKIYS